MEDRVHVEVKRNADGSIAHSFFAVYDGHGGCQAADTARDHLYDYLISHPKFDSRHDKDVLAAMREAFLQTHEHMKTVVGESRD